MHDVIAAAKHEPGETSLYISLTPGGIVSSGRSELERGWSAEETRQPANGSQAGWRSTEDGVEAWSGRYGMIPIYYFATDERIILSTSLQRLVQSGAPAEPDYPALAVFLRLGFFLGEDTPLRNVHVLPPNARLLWRPGELAVSGGFPRPAPQTLPRETALDGFIDLFADAVARRHNTGRSCLPLTGGRDSRHILLELHRQRRLPDACVTADQFPPRPNEDAVARRLADAVGAPHRVLRQPRSRFRAEITKNSLVDFCADEHAWAMPLVDQLAGSFGTSWDGLAGDVLSAGLFLDEEGVRHVEAADPERWADYILWGWDDCGEMGFRKLLTPEAYDRMSAAVAKERLVRELERHIHEHNPITSFFFWNRTRREIALCPFRMFPPSVQVHAPYLDDKLFNFLYSLPAQLYLDHSFHTDAIRRAYPEFADIPFEDKGFAPARAPLHLAQYCAETAVYAAGVRSRLIDGRALAVRLLSCIPTMNSKRLAWMQVERLLPLLQVEKLAHELCAEPGDARGS